MTPLFPHLFSPIALASRVVPNRLTLLATLTNFGVEHRITERWMNFLIERARGGTGLIISEIIAVDPEALAHGAIVTGYDDRNDAGFRATAQAVDATGSTLIGQLWHPGRQQLWHPTRSPQGVSDQPDALSWTVPHVMSVHEIERLVDAFVDVALRLKRCGFHGVELHAAHGYLLTQFLSPWSNTRDDEYGGGRDNRLRFVTAIADGIRRACGAEFIVGIKMPAEEGVVGGIDVAEARAITQSLCATGHFDYFAYSQGNFSLSLENHVPDMHFKPGHFLHLHRAMREVAGQVPVMAIGRIGTPELAEEIIASATASLIGMSRALVSDAAFARKAREGQAANIRPSVFNNSCWGEVHMGKPLAEFHNPELAQSGEANWHIAKAKRAMHVVIAGSGVAGLQCAWVAAAAGHRVTLLAASEALGGKLRLEARLPGHGEMARVYTHQRQLIEQHRVKLKCGERASADSILAHGPDAVVIATGSQMRPPEFDYGLDEHERVTSGHEFAAAWEADDTLRRGIAVLYDHDHTAATYALAQALASCYRQVIIITPRTHIAQAVNYCSAIGIFRRLYQMGVSIHPATRPVEYRNRTLTVANVFSGETSTFEQVESIVYATPRRVNDDLVQSLQERVRLHAVGDCVAPRNLLIAIHEAHHIALGLAR